MTRDDIIDNFRTQAIKWLEKTDGKYGLKNKYSHPVELMLVGFVRGWKECEKYHINESMEREQGIIA